LKRYVTLNNMIEAAQNKWYKMAIAVPGGKAAQKSKSRSETCASAASKMLPQEPI